MTYVLGAVDAQKIERGTWFDTADGQRFLVARWDNDEFLQLLETLKRPWRRKIDRGEMPAKEMTRILCQAMSQKILFGWEGVPDVDGKDIPYTPEAGFRLMRQSPDFREAIAGWAREEEAFFKSA